MKALDSVPSARLKKKKKKIRILFPCHGCTLSLPSPVPCPYHCPHTSQPSTDLCLTQEAVGCPVVMAMAASSCKQSPSAAWLPDWLTPFSEAVPRSHPALDPFWVAGKLMAPCFSPQGGPHLLMAASWLWDCPFS